MSSQLQIDDTISALFSPLIAPSDTAELGKAPGILVGVTYKGTPSLYSFGCVPMAQSGTAPATGDIVMFIGSNTKVFTATLLALASFSTPNVPINGFTEIASLLPTGVTANQWQDTPIRLWHLASHSAGYPDGPCGQTVWGDYTFDMTTAFLKNFTPRYEPGRYWLYSDQGFALLGALLSRAYEGNATLPDDWDATYQAWPTIVGDQVLSQLAMDSTQVGYNGGDLTKLAQSFSYKTAGKPYCAEATPDVVMQSAALGAGALTSTLTDMLTFLDNQISPPDGSLGSAIALTQKSVGNGLSMGLGWQTGQGYFEKNGLVAGYASYMAFDPTSGYGIFAMANSRGGDDGGTLCNTARQALGALGGNTTKPPYFPKPPHKLKPCCPSA